MIQSIENTLPTFEEIKKSAEEIGTDLKDSKYKLAMVVILKDIFLQDFPGFLEDASDIWSENLTAEDKERILVYLEHLAGIIENEAAKELVLKFLSKVYKYGYPLYEVLMLP